jgi:hypothetical protein
MSTTTPAIKAILMLVTIVVVIGIFTGLSNPVVQVLLGFADEATLDDGTKEKYSYLKDINEENINSINALLFSVNAIAHYDTNLKTDTQKEAFLLTMFGQNQERVFGNQVVKYIFFNIEPVQIEKKDSIDVATRKIIDYATRCYYIFEDNGKERSRCYALDMSQADFETNKITEQHIEEQAELYMDSGNCDDTCKETVNLLFLKTNGLRFDMSITGSMKKQEYYFCAEPGGLHANHLWTPRVYLVDSINHHSCDIKDKNKEAIGFKVTNFNMEQDVGDISNVKSFLFGYKPSILYYEVADKSITQDFEADIYRTSLAEIAGEAIFYESIFFLIFDAVPFGGTMAEAVGKVVMKEIVGETAEAAGKVFFKKFISELVQEIGGEKNLVSVIKAFKKVYSKSMEEVSQRMGVEGAQAGFREFMQLVIRNELLHETVEKHGKAYVRQQYGEVIEEMVQKNLGDNIDNLGHEAYEAYIKNTGDYLQLGLLDIVDQPGMYKNGKLTEQGVEALEKRLNQNLDHMISEFDLASIKNLDTHANLRMLNQELAQEMQGFSFKKLTKFAKRQSKILSKMSLKVNKIIAGASSEEKEQILKEMMEGNVEARFGSMIDNPKDLRKFITSNKKSFGELQELYGEKTFDDMLKYVDESVLSNHRYWSTVDRELMTQAKQAGAVKWWPLSVPNPVTALKNKNYRRANTLMLGMFLLSAKEVSDAEIFHPIGINSFGYKTTLSTPAIFDDYLRNNWHYETAQGRKDYNEYFKYYGNSIIPGRTDREEDIDEETGIDYKQELYLSEKYTGTIPNISRYFVSLVKDKRKVWSDQHPERFYLVAPCKADINVKISQAKCFGNERESSEGFFAKEAIYETGRFNSLLDTRVEHFDGDNAMLYKVDENGDFIKLCDPRIDLAELSLNPFKTMYTPTAIEIDPIIDPTQEMNYCYEGKDWKQSTYWTTLNLGAPLLVGGIGAAGCGLATGGAFAMPCYYVGQLIGGIGGSIAYQVLDANTGTKWHWPYHSSE